MHRPVAIVRWHVLAGALVEIAGRYLFHGDAVFNRAYIDAQVAADTFLIDHFKTALSINQIGDRLVRGVLAGNVAAPAFDAAVLIDRALVV